MIHYSIIIPHHNMPERLRRLIKSLPSRSDLQVIVIDDCSDQFLSDYELLKIDFPNIEWYSTESNGGAGKARNIGLQNARGQYVIFADSDDYFNPSLNSILDKYIETEEDLIYFPTSCLGEFTYQNNGYLTYLNSLIRSAIYNQINIKYRLTYPWSKIINTRLIHKHELKFEESIVSNDVRFSTLCDFYAKKTKIDNTAFYCYMHNNISVSRSLNLEKIITRLKIDAWRWQFLKQNNVTHIPISKVLGQLMDKIIFIKDKKYKKEIKNIFKEFHISEYEYYFLWYRSQLKRIVKGLRYSFD